MATELKNIYTTTLQCNCPECFSNTGLQMSYKQEWKDTFWITKATDIVREELYCKHCEFQIYPVKWTSDIERLYEYHLKKADKESYFKIKSQAYMIAFMILALLALMIYVIINR